MWKEGGKPFFDAREKNEMGLAPSDKGIEMILHVEPGATIYDAVPRWVETFG